MLYKAITLEYFYSFLNINNELIYKMHNLLRIYPKDYALIFKQVIEN